MCSELVGGWVGALECGWVPWSVGGCLGGWVSAREGGWVPGRVGA